jgi:hypothetical protein
VNFGGQSPFRIWLCELLGTTRHELRAEWNAE